MYLVPGPVTGSQPVNLKLLHLPGVLAGGSLANAGTGGVAQVTG